MKLKNYKTTIKTILRHLK